MKEKKTDTERYITSLIIPIIVRVENVYIDWVTDNTPMSQNNLWKHFLLYEIIILLFIGININTITECHLLCPPPPKKKSSLQFPVKITKYINKNLFVLQNAKLKKKSIILFLYINTASDL